MVHRRNQPSTSAAMEKAEERARVWFESLLFSLLASLLATMETDSPYCQAPVLCRLYRVQDVLSPPHIHRYFLRRRLERDKCRSRYHGAFPLYAWAKDCVEYILNHGTVASLIEPKLSVTAIRRCPDQLAFRASSALTIWDHRDPPSRTFCRADATAPRCDTVTKMELPRDHCGKPEDLYTNGHSLHLLQHHFQKWQCLKSNSAYEG
jgi:hypothetical protein